MVTRDSLRDERSPSARLRVLLAEDNDVNRKLAVRLIEKRGHRVTRSQRPRGFACIRKGRL